MPPGCKSSDDKRASVRSARISPLVPWDVCHGRCRSVPTFTTGFEEQWATELLLVVALDACRPQLRQEEPARGEGSGARSQH